MIGIHLIKKCVIDMVKDKVIVNLDYCGSCRGTCPTCVLTVEERLNNFPLMNKNTVIKGFEKVIDSIGNEYDNFIVGFGRGNHLVLDEYTVNEIVDICHYIEDVVFAREYLYEISTSLVGKIDKQIERAKLILDTAKQSGLKGDFRFVIVANVGVSSPNYWRNVQKFMDSMIEFRGGNIDGSGDIIQINLAIDSLPDLDWLGKYIFSYRNPINIAWVPYFDEHKSNPELMRNFENWMVEFVRTSHEKDLDTNIVNWGENSIQYLNQPIVDLEIQIETSSNSLLYISTDGEFHNGYPTIMADMDPVRFDPESSSLDNDRQSNLSNKGDFMRLMKFKSCRECKYFNACVHSGGYRIALINSRYNERKIDFCLNGLRKSFEYLENDTDVS